MDLAFRRENLNIFFGSEKLVPELTVFRGGGVNTSA